MKTRPVRPAHLAFDENGNPYSPVFNDVYHTRDGALAQARHVFLGGNGLPQRWQDRPDFSVLETGFGLGNNFLATWATWRADPRRCAHLHYVSIEKHPLRHDDLSRVHDVHASSSAAGASVAVFPTLEAELIAAWPALTPNLHRLSFDGGRVELLLAFGDVAEWLPEIVGRFDAFYLDGFAPPKNPQMWQRRLFRALGRLAAPQATAATWSVAREVRDGLTEAGFAVERTPGFGSKREMTQARFAPRHTPQVPAGRALSVPASRDVVIVGAGLAGCATAAALAAAGFECTVIDRQGEPAAETSGQRGGLFHGVLHPDDGVHARFGRAAALHATRILRDLIERGVVPGSASGLVRTETHLTSVAAMRALLQTQGLPPDYVEALDAETATVRAGVPMQTPAWFYPGGGWVDPGALCHHWLTSAADGRIHWLGNTAVDRLHHDGTQWHLLGNSGTGLARARTVVLANAQEAQGLLGADWPLQRVRGQTSILPAQTPGLLVPHLPLAGAGYALRLLDGQVLCGATSHAEDATPHLRETDQATNLARLNTLTESTVSSVPCVNGRVGWRLMADDRLPLVGPVPDAVAANSAVRIDQPRFVPRRPGLFVHIALGSRGIAWAPLGGQLLAAQIAGAPCPLEAGLIDAIDPARFISRQARRQS